MSRAARRAMVRRRDPELSLSRQCRLLSIGRSWLYYTPQGESAETLARMRRIDELFLKHPFYGARQIVRHLRREGVRIGRRRAGRLMRLMGLQAIYRAPRTSEPHPEHRVYPYLLKGLAIERANHVGCADITLHPCAARLSLLGGDHGLGEPVCAGLAFVEHPGRRLLRRGCRPGSACSLRRGHPAIGSPLPQVGGKGFAPPRECRRYGSTSGAGE